MGIIAAGKTDIGMKRSTNQDSIVLVDDENLFVVADGMGGHNGGDIASQLSVQNFPRILKQNIDRDPKELLGLCVQEVNNLIFKKAEQEPLLKGMGTTIVANYYKGQHIYISNVGDSRCYMVNNKKLFQMTRDHSFVQEKINHGLCTREQAKADKQKNVITRAVGHEPDVEVDVFSYKVSKNDLFLICSDGLHGKVCDADILYLVNKFVPNPGKARPADLDKLAQALIDQANQNGGQDNISVIVSVAQ